MRTSLIVAMARGRVIGLEGGLPWHLPADLKHFKAVTMGSPIIMGRKTYESIGRALPGRANIVITRNPDYTVADAEVVHDVPGALKKAQAITYLEGGEEVFVIGGAEIYALALAEADRIYLTEIDLDVSGDAHFPELDTGQWAEIGREEHPAGEDTPAFRFLVLDRMG